MVYDIYGNEQYKWTQDKANSCVPYIKLFEYTNVTDSLVQEMLYLKKAHNIYGNQSQYDEGLAAGSFKDVYKNLYQVIPTDNIFKLPYIKQEGYTLDTRYSQIDPKASTLGSKVQQIWNNITNTFNYELGDQGDGLFAINNTETEILNKTRSRRQGTQLAKQSVKAYSGSNFGEYSTTFNLLNETKDLQDHHQNFIQTMLRNNTPAFATIMAIKVPVVYAIEISGLYKIPLGFISKFSARPKGNVIVKSGKYIPDAWEISMSFNSLLPISQQILNIGFNGVAQVTNDIKGIFSEKTANSKFPSDNLDLPSTGNGNAVAGYTGGSR